MVDTYIFDLDDTIVDSKIYARIYPEVVKQLLSHLQITEIELQEVITRIKEEGKPRPDSFDLCNKLNSTDIYYHILEKSAKHSYSIKTKSIPLLFRKIKDSGRRIGIVSRSQERTMRIFLERYNLDAYVDFLESGSKDTVLFWMTIQKKYNLDPAKTLVIDDSDNVLDIARHSGYLTLNVKDIEDLAAFKF